MWHVILLLWDRNNQAISKGHGKYRCPRSLLNLGKFISVDENILSNCQQFIQTVLYKRTTKESYIETRVRLYNDQKTKSSTEVSKQSDEWTTYQELYWLHCTKTIHPHISFEVNGWINNENINIMKFFWFDGPQFPPSTIKKKIEWKRSKLLMVIKKIKKTM